MGYNKLLTNGKVVYKGRLLDADLAIEKGRITYIGKVEDIRKYEEVIDVQGHYVIPGMIDIHTHGGNQIDINHAHKEDLLELSKFFASRGVTSYLPTLATDTHETMCYLLKEISRAKQEQIEGAQILGVHMEGPFLCTAFKGAMPGDLIQDGSIERVKYYEETAKGLIKYMTISPENIGSIDVISYLKEKGIVAAIGHTGADYERSIACIKAGASSATHVFNAMGSIHQHRPAAIGAALESDVYCEMICDGFHLHPGIVRLMIKTKGMDKIIAITDSIMAAGLEDGNYELGVNDIIVKNGDAQLLDGVRAGSTLTMDKVLKNLIEFTGMPLEKVIDFMTINPAKLLGIYEDKGEIEVGKEADLVILDAEYMPICTLIKGNITYRANEKVNKVI